MEIKFIFDIASPNAYLSYKVIPDFEKKYDVKFDYFICLLGGIFKLSNNKPPMIANAEIPHKNNYFGQEITRFVKFHQLLDFKMNPHFPINTLNIQRGALAAQNRGNFTEYLDCIAKGMWEEEKNFNDIEILKNYLLQNDINGKEILELAATPEIKQKLIDNTSKAYEMGVFGVPTFFVGKEMFFGKEAFREIPDFL
tara:strand:+ start:1006 stop:1596 length:591 start_codon:yes stop_codon:yes gene_type:complete